MNNMHEAIIITIIHTFATVLNSNAAYMNSRAKRAFTCEDLPGYSHCSGNCCNETITTSCEKSMPENEA